MAHPELEKFYKKYRPNGPFVWPESGGSSNPTKAEFKVFTDELTAVLEVVSHEVFNDYVAEQTEIERAAGLHGDPESNWLPEDKTIITEESLVDNENSVYEHYNANKQRHVDFEAYSDSPETIQYWEEAQEVMDNATDKERHQFMIWFGENDAKKDME